MTETLLKLLNMHLSLRLNESYWECLWRFDIKPKRQPVCIMYYVFCIIYQFATKVFSNFVGCQCEVIKRVKRQESIHVSPLNLARPIIFHFQSMKGNSFFAAIFTIPTLPFSNFFMVVYPVKIYLKRFKKRYSTSKKVHLSSENQLAAQFN